jgi:hypothetical protein
VLPAAVATDHVEADSIPTDMPWSPELAAALINGTVGAVYVAVSLFGKPDLYLNGGGDAFASELERCEEGHVDVHVMFELSGSEAASKWAALRVPHDDGETASSRGLHLRFLWALITSPHVDVALARSAALHRYLLGVFGLQGVTPRRVLDIDCLAQAAFHAGEETLAQLATRIDPVGEQVAALNANALATRHTAATDHGAVRAAATVQVVALGLREHASRVGALRCAELDASATFATAVLAFAGCPISRAAADAVEAAAENAVREAADVVTAMLAHVFKDVPEQQRAKAVADEAAVLLSNGAQALKVTSLDHVMRAAGQPLGPELLRERRFPALLAAAAELHPVGDALRRYYSLCQSRMKLATTFASFAHSRLDSPQREADVVCVHATYSFLRVDTGRIFTSRPNLQTLPPNARRAVVSPPGTRLVTVDFNQIELRVVAALSGDAALLLALRQADVIASVAALALGKDATAVTPTERAHAKVVVYGLLYGLGDARLQERLGTDGPRARDLRRQFFAAFPRLEEWLSQVQDAAVATHRTQAPSGRWRQFDGGAPGAVGIGHSFADAAAIGRQAVALHVQGSAADILKAALHRVLQVRGAVPVLTVHDEIVFAVEETRLNDVVPNIVELMQNAPRDIFDDLLCQRLGPLPVTVKVGSDLSSVAAWPAEVPVAAH